ncbi:DegT/DnrJ/EryC1/StrS family aminotransferase [Patescibacteria group bacterium]|nr:DegT/DnrJ/EryC1/StrS family aminotransferase [Patescibacteria group bacterium]MBU4367933.1 DegT/DnrJ/EryC1/StrS family aminotransferase [Patescibacteria group bacterium]MBU4462271.1 DegT/DnrJ/EryC1/StrS family aminotransferase [Patescibacteria group bacterium]MCG2699543.1 DegT/DnrJ/EryC1/StrS family aminotransferase [Candidatus Parcubacteria bacterium]
MLKPISISLNPNVEKDDVRLALKLIFQPWKWKRGKELKEIENQLKNYLGVKYAVSFNSGRSALMAILKALNLSKDSEVLLQAYTCVAAVNPILWEGLKPVYIDCQDTDFNLNISDFKAKTGPNSRVLMVQHTFGLPANMDEIMAIVRDPKGTPNLVLIEDCAHSLGAEYRGQKIGTFGKAAFFSFGRDKVISSVYGGMVVTNDDQIAESLYKIQKEFNTPSCYWIFQQLLHPILMSYIILPLYNILDLGKIFLVLSQWFGILSKAVHWKEKIGKKPGYFPKNMPNALAVLALNQFKKLERFNKHRQEIAEFYYKELANTLFGLPPKFPDRKNIFMRFTVKHPKAHEIIYEAWHKRNIIVGDWYITPIIPHDTKLEKVDYKMGSCPVAEKLSKITLNLPTHINISQKDAKTIVDFLQKYKQ